MSNGGRPDERCLRQLPTLLGSGSEATPQAAGLLTLGRAAGDSSTAGIDEGELHPPTSEEMQVRCPSCARRADPAATTLIDRASIMPAAITTHSLLWRCVLWWVWGVLLECLSSDHADEFS